MHIVRSSILGFGVVASLAGAAMAQQPPAEPPPPPPPPAPDPNWAPPLPQEPPPPTPPPAATAPPPAAPPPADTAAPAPAAEPEPGTKFEIYGFTMFDGGYDFGKIGDPDWQDTVRPTKLPAFRNQFGKGDRTFLSVRQSRFGVKASTPTAKGDLKTTFEFELFGTGPDTGQTTFRLRHAYGDWWQLRAGQTWSPFMDIDVFPNSLEYWGPNGMVFFRNIQLAWMPIRGDSRVTVALERPGASPDAGIYADRIELADTTARFPLPDLSAEARYGGAWGYVEAAGILRYIKWDDLNPDPPRLDGDAIGWGINLSSNIKAGPTVIRLQGVYGEAIQNYMNDAAADIGPQNTTDPAAPVEGVALPVLGLVGFVDIEWTKRFSTAAGYSLVWVDNTPQQTADAFHIGHYALANLLFRPTEKLVLGGELQFGRRENFDDGWDVNDYRFQVSVKYSFSKTFGGE